MKRGPAILITLLVCALFAVFFVYPAGMVVKQAFEGPDGFTLEFFIAIFQNPIYREGLWNSFAIGSASTLAALCIAFPLALVGHRYDFIGKPALGVLVLAPMILPPFVGAVGVKQMLGVNGAFNAALVKAGLMDAAAAA
jgi:iron(III) transport system permease protein